MSELWTPPGLAAPPPERPVLLGADGQPYKPGLLHRPQADGSVILDIPQEVGGTIKFTDWIRSLSLREFHHLYARLWSQERLQYEKWVLWEGQRGWPGQGEMLDAIELSIILHLFKTRQIAATTAYAMYMAKLCISEEKTLCLIFNKDMPTAKATLKERVKPCLDALALLRAPDGGTLPWPRWEINTEFVDFDGDARIEAKPSTSSGAISRTPRVNLWDEVREFEDEQASEMLTSILPTLHQNAQLGQISTNKPGTWWSKRSAKMLTEFREVTGTVQGGAGHGAIRLPSMPKVTFMFIPADVVPERRDEAWVKSEKATYDSEAKFTRENPRDPEEAFLTNEGLVLPSFASKCKKIPAHLARGISWWPGDEFRLYYDHGRTEGHPAVCWFVHYRPKIDHMHVFAEVFRRGSELPDTAAEIKEKVELWWKQGAPSVTKAVGDVTGKEFSRRQQETRNIKECLEEEIELGITWEPAWKQDSEASLELFRQRTFHGRFTIDPANCKSSVYQLENIKFKKDSDDPSDKEDEGLDLGRYASHDLQGEGTPPPETYVEKLLAAAFRGRDRETTPELLLPPEPRPDQPTWGMALPGGDTGAGGGVGWGL